MILKLSFCCKISINLESEFNQFLIFIQNLQLSCSTEEEILPIIYYFIIYFGIMLLVLKTLIIMLWIFVRFDFRLHLFHKFFTFELLLKSTLTELRPRWQDIYKEWWESWTKISDSTVALWVGIGLHKLDYEVDIMMLIRNQNVFVNF